MLIQEPQEHGFKSYYEKRYQSYAILHLEKKEIERLKSNVNEESK